MLTAFNYAQGRECRRRAFHQIQERPVPGLRQYRWARQIATNPVSNQFLFDNATPLPDLGGLTQFQYLQTHWVFTDHTQWTGSAGGTYQFCSRPARPDECDVYGCRTPHTLCGIRFSGDMIYGSGLRDGDANISTVPPYTQFNVGVAREFLWPLIRSR